LRLLATRHPCFFPRAHSHAFSRRAQFSERKPVQGWRGAILRGYQGRKPAGCACPANMCARWVLCDGSRTAAA